MRYFEDINSTLNWYQNHVGAYDKAKWEQTVEERILNGINHIPTKSTKLASELIDLDLVQGSSFPKAKSKFGLYTVAKHGLARLFFLPFYGRWWTRISSPKLYLLFLLLYSIQIINIGLYLTQPPSAPANGNVTAINNTNGAINDTVNPNGAGGGASGEAALQTTEIVAPVVLMIVLTILHSQIIATHDSLYGNSSSKATGAAAPKEQKKSSASSSSKYSGTRLPRKRSSLTGAGQGGLLIPVQTTTGNTLATATGGGQAPRGTKRGRPRFPRRRSSALASTGTSNSPARRLETPKRLSVNETQLDNVLSGGVGLRRRRAGVGHSKAVGSGRDGDDEDHHDDEEEEGRTLSPTGGGGGGGLTSSLKNSPNSRTRSGNEDTLERADAATDSGAEYFHRFPALSSSIDSIQDPIIKKHLAETISTLERDEAKTFPLLHPHQPPPPTLSFTSPPPPECASISISNSNHTNTNAKNVSAVSCADLIGNGDGLCNGALPPSSSLNGGAPGATCNVCATTPAASALGNLGHPVEGQSLASETIETIQIIPSSSSTPPKSNNGAGSRQQQQRRRPRPRIQSEETSFSADEPPRTGSRRSGAKEEADEEEDEDGNTSSEEHQLQLKKKKPTEVGAPTPTPGGGAAAAEEEEDEEEEEALLLEEEDEEVRSKSEWTAVTTNSEDEDYVAEEDNDAEGDSDHGGGGGGGATDAFFENHPFAWEFYSSKTSPSCTSSDRVSCTIWEGQDTKKADLSVLDISATIISRVERARDNSDYLYLGMVLSVVLATLPCLWRLNLPDTIDIDLDFNRAYDSLVHALAASCGGGWRSRLMIGVSALERLCLSFFVFFLLAVAEKTYKQRFLYSKLFSRITSTRKAKKSGIPHFRLNKVRNIKTWLSVRSYLQKRGPQRSVNIIVSSTFISVIILIFFLSVELLKETARMYYLYNIEVLMWSLFLGIYLLRFMTLGARISQKYRNLSVIITEQLNLYLKMEQKPHKKDELMVANNVLKLAAELLKELDDPFKISSFATNPYLYNITRIVILSAFSGVLSEMLGFKLKLYKIKLK